MKAKCCSWSMMTMVPMMMMGMKAMSSARRGQSCSMPAAETGCRETSAAPGRTAPAKDIVDAAVSAGVFSKLVAAVQAAGLVETLKGKGPFTVFAPTDEAFAKVPAEILEAAMKDPNLLKSVLTFHVVPGRYTSADLAGIDSLKTVQGSPLKVDLASGVQIGTARVVKADVAAANGVIHVIDSVLIPQ